MYQKKHAPASNGPADAHREGALRKISVQLRGFPVGEKTRVVHVLVGVAVFCEAHVLAAGEGHGALTAFTRVFGVEAPDRNQNKGYGYTERGREWVREFDQRTSRPGQDAHAVAKQGRAVGPALLK